MTIRQRLGVTKTTKCRKYHYGKKLLEIVQICSGIYYVINNCEFKKYN